MEGSEGSSCVFSSVRSQGFLLKQQFLIQSDLGDERWKVPHHLSFLTEQNHSVLCFMNIRSLTSDKGNCFNFNTVANSVRYCVASSHNTQYKMKCIAIVISLSLLAPARAFIPSVQRPALTQIFAEGDTILYSDDEQEQEKKLSGNKRWASLSPSVKARIRKEGQERAVINKKKREPIADKKRRMMMHYKQAMAESKSQSRVERPFPTNSPDRTTLKDMVVGEIYNGTVISLTNFGAYVDIGSECDGLLHVSQISRQQFVEHPRQLLKPGDVIDVTLVKCGVDMKKMQVSMLDQEILAEENEEEEEFQERIPLEDLSMDDELWGEIKRVTSFGAYVELGATVQGWMHFMDHVEFDYGKEPSDLMKVGDRIRCWVANVDEERERLKLTGNRPKDLPGPRREMMRKADVEY